jgi:hypothetical protein
MTTVFEADRGRVRDALEAINSVSGERLTFADVTTNEHGDPVLRDETVGPRLREQFLSQKVFEADRGILGDFEAALNILAPTEEAYADDLYRREVDRVTKENTVRRREGQEELALPPRPGADTYKAKAPKGEKPKKGAAKKADDRKATRLASGVDPLNEGGGREDVLELANTFSQKVGPGETEQRHEMGVLTPKEYGVREVLSPAEDDPELVLSPKDEANEPVTLRESARLAEARLAEDQAAQTAEQSDREFQEKIDLLSSQPKSKLRDQDISRLEKQREERKAQLRGGFDAAKSEVKRLEKQANKVVSENIEKAPPLKTMAKTPEDDPRAAGEKPTVGEEIAGAQKKAGARKAQTSASKSRAANKKSPKAATGAAKPAKAKPSPKATGAKKTVQEKRVEGKGKAAKPAKAGKR